MYTYIDNPLHPLIPFSLYSLSYSISSPLPSTLLLPPFPPHHLWFSRHCTTEDVHSATLKQSSKVSVVCVHCVCVCGGGQLDGSVFKLSTLLKYPNILISAASISEIPLEGLQYLMSSQQTFNCRWLTTIDFQSILQAVYYSGLPCNLQFHSCCFGVQAVKTILKGLPILHSGGTVQKLRWVSLCVEYVTFRFSLVIDTIQEQPSK